MAGTKQARAERKRRPKSMSLTTLSGVLTKTIYKLEDQLDISEDSEEIRKTAHALATVAGTFIKLKETTELEQRLAELEKAMEAKQ